MAHFSTAPPGEEWNWLRQLQFSYHKLAQSFITTWFTKATPADDSPPKAKHVRRIIVAFLRVPSVQLRTLAQYTYEQRSWRDDTRVAAKSLYIILILLQYRTDFRLDYDIPHFTDRVVSYLSDHPFSNEKQQLYSNVAQRIGAVIHEKLVFHTAHPNVHGNFYVPGNAVLSEIIPALRIHLSRVLYETVGIQAAVTQSEDFVATVLWEPMVEETIGAYRLLKVIDKAEEAVPVLKDCETLVLALPKFPYIASIVILPGIGEEVTIPKERYPKIEDLPQ
jgi:hypothetical protein